MPDGNVCKTWSPAEFVLEAEHLYANPYTAVDVWADFEHELGTLLRRPAFFDGGDCWRVRFAAPEAGRWTWRTSATVDDPGLTDRRGVAVAFDDDVQSRFRGHGFWRMSPGGRSLVHADGYPALIVADTAWALPWRATTEQVRDYARDRHEKGFNAVLLMSVQPDMRAEGPRDRTQDGGFDVAFEDLPRGHLNDINPTYFQYLDGLVEVLWEHEIVPVLQPVFQGFGWKGLDVAGTVVPPAEYARYCRYLVARYGAGPVVYLVGADGIGLEPQVEAGGREVHEWDCYAQPTGIHYRPHAHNDAHQEADWLDFQWCQTGHRGEHVPERVSDMWRNTPPKAVANGEPSYEHTRSARTAAGWWQGHEAWSNLCAGGTMGVVYGAANIWQWKLHPEEPGHAAYFLAPTGGWRESLHLEGSSHVGRVARILEGVPTTDMAPDWQTFVAVRGLRVPGVLNIVYQEHGGLLNPPDDADVPLRYRIVDPATGATIETGTRTPGTPVGDDRDETRVVIFCDQLD